MRAVGDRAVDLAGAVDRVRGTALDPAAMDMARLDEPDADVAGDAAHRLAPADHLRDRRLVHTVLQRNDITARRQILAYQQCRPVGVVGFGADKGDVDRRFPGKLLRLGQMQGPHLDRERFFALVMGDPQAVPLHLLDMSGPEIDEGHVLAGAHHMRSGIAAHGTRADDRDLLAHPGSPGCIAPHPSAALRGRTIGPDAR